MNARPSDNDVKRTIRNPARLIDVIGELPLTSTERVLRAVEAAESAFSGWSAVEAADRASFLSRAADAVDAEHGDWTTLLTREHGKTLREAGAEIGNAVGVLRYYAGLAEQYEQELELDDHLGRRIQRRHPFGVAAVIVPWNYPVILALLMTAPALLAGNTVIVKLPDHAALAVRGILGRLVDLLPPGVLQIVAGDATGVGSVLTTHPRIRKVLFTGSTDTGRVIMRDASANLKSLSLELGGNDPAIVLEDARLDDGMITELVRGAFSASGQVCYAPKRIYVHRSRFDEFVDGYLSVADELVVGDGLETDVTMGPVNNDAQFRHVRSLIQASADGGGTVRTVGRMHSGSSENDGFFILPTVVTGLGQSADLVQKEQFGPAIPILPFESEVDAVRMANDSEYGLAASVWSADSDHAFDLARRIEAGTVFVNIHRVGASDVSMPFGGFKQSGLGRGHGFVALEECSESQLLVERSDLRGHR